MTPADERLALFLERCLHKASIFGDENFDEFRAKVPGTANRHRRQAERIVAECRRVGVDFVFPKEA